MAGLAEPCRKQRITKVLGGAVALSLGVGFVAVRKVEGLLPGPQITVAAGEDYRGL